MFCLRDRNVAGPLRCWKGRTTNSRNCQPVETRSTHGTLEPARLRRQRLFRGNGWKTGPHPASPPHRNAPLTPVPGSGSREQTSVPSSVTPVPSTKRFPLSHEGGIGSAWSRTPLLIGISHPRGTHRGTHPAGIAAHLDAYA